eukprot:scaffold50262_cov66-Phaeocystis_antarctica.AAC.3
MRRPPATATATGAGGSWGKGVCTGSDGRLKAEAPCSLCVATSNSYQPPGASRRSTTRVASLCVSSTHTMNPPVPPTWIRTWWPDTMPPPSSSSHSISIVVGPMCTARGRVGWPGNRHGENRSKCGAAAAAFASAATTAAASSCCLARAAISRSKVPWCAAVEWLRAAAAARSAAAE